MSFRKGWLNLLYGMKKLLEVWYISRLIEDGMDMVGAFG